LAISPYGHFSKKAEEMSNVPDSNLTAQAYNGYPLLIGNPSVRPVPLRGHMGCMGDGGRMRHDWHPWTLYERLKSGKGRLIDVATHEALATVHAYPIVASFLFGRSRPQYGFLDYILYPFGVFKTRDGTSP